ncbi:MAG TPA: hypothetical protein VK045_01995 [Ornithinicoccus sp.]|nr:hypothetical protein [Ornithinicoccus sp.]
MFRDTLDMDLLGLYLSDHLTGATGGLYRARRMADDYGDELGQLRTFAAELEEERDLLARLIDDLGLRQRRHRQALAWAAEHLGRLKLNGRLFSTSPMTVHLELELLRAAVNGKAGLFETLVELSDELGLDPATYQHLADRALRQSEMLAGLHATVRGSTFRRDVETA